MSKPISDSVEQLFPAVLVPQLTDEEWEARDAEVQAQRDALARKQARREHEMRATILQEGNAPDLLSERVYEDSFDPNSEAMKQMEGFMEDKRQIRILSGGTGTGKTFAALRWQGDHGGKSPFFMRATEFFGAGAFDKDFRRRWKNSSSLIVDDLGTEYADKKGMLISGLDELFDFCAGRKARTVITTNLHADEFSKRYGHRILSRIRESANWRSVVDVDRRGG